MLDNVLRSQSFLKARVNSQCVRPPLPAARGAERAVLQHALGDLHACEPRGGRGAGAERARRARVPARCACVHMEDIQMHVGEQSAGHAADHDRPGLAAQPLHHRCCGVCVLFSVDAGHVFEFNRDEVPYA